MGPGSVSFDVPCLHDIHRSAKMDSSWVSLYEVKLNIRIMHFCEIYVTVILCKIVRSSGH